MADEAGRILLKCLSKGGRKLRREMVVHMNKDDIQEERPGLDDEAKQAWIREEAAKCHRVVIRHKKVGGRPSSASTKSAQGLLLIKLTRNLPCCRAWMMKLC
ncbi:unnamed protein product [Durusdinium trenchii]|uniref:Uncharacterized protein n=1 Tax=Durusdinium trenchii TaxID=1381693 RepID=A0ABP0MNI1_9DINO